MARFADTDDRVRLAYEVSGAGRPPLLFLHGWGCDRSYFAAQMSHFAAHHVVAALDLRGHGESGCPDPNGAGYGVARLGADALTVARAAGLTRPVVIGHSLGALAALACAARRGATRAAVLVDPAPVRSRSGKEFFRRSAAEVAADTDGSWRRAFVTGLFLPTDTVRREETIARAARQPARIGAAICRAMAEFDGDAALAKVQVPLLVIAAGEPERGLREPHPAITLRRTVGAGHYCQLEVPAQVGMLIEQFLAEKVPVGA